MKNQRLASIDILRSITMVLMIWVNDFWSLKEIPKWLKHASWGEDYLGFSDIIFPLFLFIVGLSIPLSIQQRERKNESNFDIIKHTFLRSTYLIVIGIFMVNYESIHSGSLIMNRLLYCLIMTIAIGLIWMHWKKSPIQSKWHIYLQIVGIILLVFLAIIYKGGQNGELWMTTQWWGILGLIGWSYLINVLLYIISQKKIFIIIGVFLIFFILSSLKFTIGIPPLPNALFFLNPIYGGTIPAFTTGGIIATLLVQKLSIKSIQWTLTSLISIGIICIVFGILTRPIWGISKMSGTPSWLGICVGISFIIFAIIHFITDVKGKTKWANFISAAGTATLTCYMLPYIIEPLIGFTGIKLPDVLYVGIMGLIKSFIFALLIILLTRFFEKHGFKLKL